MYVPYQPISKKGDETAFVPIELQEAQQQGIKLLPSKLTTNWDEWVAKEIGFNNKEELFEVFSAEQIDSIGLTIYNFNNGHGFIIADETGIGKGRILSGICRWAITHGKKIMFFTERESLFTDFWRDLNDTKTIPLLEKPVVFHGTAKVYDQNTGDVVLKGVPKSVKEISKNGFLPETNFVMTSYSQISGKTHKETKQDIMIDYCNQNLIIMDESHNGTGDSNTKKFLMSLTEVSSNIVFSSATYIKDESQLDIYEKVISFDSSTIKLMKKLLKSDENMILRKVFTYELTKKLQFWRREHAPIEGDWKTVLCERYEEQSKYLNQFSYTLNSLFAIVNQLIDNPALSNMQIENVWFSLGATINRLSRNLLLLFKIDDLCDSIINNSLANNHKAVVVIDSTFSSIINKVIAFQNKYKIQENTSLEDDDVESDSEEFDEKLANSDYKLNFQQILLYIIDEVIGNVIEEHKPIIDQEIITAFEQLKDSTILFEPLQISPIDMIIQNLAKHGIKANEISGRTIYINEEGKVTKLQKRPKPHLVAEFNNGEVDVTILTRAGASGLSLHASAAFKDQRIRDLYELEINTRSTYRLQFIGRVNRKNQVVQPEFYTVVTKLAFEQRILNMEQEKLKKLQSHISGDETKLSQSTVLNFYTNYCDEAAKQFLKAYPKVAFQMGISLKKKKDPLYYVDSLLKRCIVLSSEQQEFIYKYLIYATECELKLNVRLQGADKVQYSNMTTFWHEMDTDMQSNFKQTFGKIPEASINQFKFPWVGIMEVNSTYHTNSLFEFNLESSLSKNMQKQNMVQTYLNNVLSYIYKKQEFDLTFINKTISPLLKNIRIGTQLNLKTTNGTIHGYIHDITFPNVPKPYTFSNLCLIHIKTVNPHLRENIFYAPEDYFINLNDFIETKVQISNNPINWSNYTRPKREFQRKNYCFIGHPVYIEFLHQCYGIGEIRYMQVGFKKNMCLFLPDGINPNDVLKMKRPIYNANRIREALFSGYITELSTTWQEETEIKPQFKIMKEDGCFKLLVAEEILKDNEIIDFPLRRMLSDRDGRLKGFSYFRFNYKNIGTLLHMFEKREYLWFYHPNPNYGKTKPAYIPQTNVYSKAPSGVYSKAPSGKPGSNSVAIPISKSIDKKSNTNPAQNLKKTSELKKPGSNN